jgi:UDP-glucose 4-epimerase
VGSTAGNRVLVTGGSGFIGGHVVRALRGAGLDVTVADRVPYPGPEVRCIVGDLRDPEVADAAVEQGSAGIVHLAAATSVLRSISDPAGLYEHNVAVTARLLELARVRGVQRFVFASTNAVVGDVGTAPIAEDAPLLPLTPYGATKAACEMLLSAYAACYGMACCALRLTNVYGPGMVHKDSLVPRIMRAASGGEGVSVYGDGRQRRDFVHVDDVVRALLLVWRRRYSGRLVVGSGRSVTVLELLDAARAVTGAALPAVHVEARAGEMPAVVVDLARARGLGYAPAVSVEAGLATVWADTVAGAGRAVPAGGA